VAKRAWHCACQAVRVCAIVRNAVRFLVSSGDWMTKHLKVEGIDADWMTSALEPKYPGVKVTSLAQSDAIWGASGKVPVRLRYNSAGEDAGLPDRMIVKGGFGMTAMAHMYGIEVASFDAVVPTLDVNAPRCYFAGPDPQFGDPILLLEDLRTSNVRFNNALDPLDYPQARRCVQAMARYHASWWGSEELSGNARFQAIDEIVAPPSVVRLAREAQPEVWSRYLKLPRGSALPKSITDPERLFPALHRLWELNKQSPYCLIHNDCHVGNTYVYPDDRVGFLDWAAKRAPWYKDFAYFLVTALEIDTRRLWERQLLTDYLSVIRERGIEAPMFEEAWRLYRCELVYSFIVWTCNGDDKGQFQDEAINTACAVRAGMAVLDHGSIDLLS
jgi:hypothetical protein